MSSKRSSETAPAGLDESTVRRIVERFYQHVHRDPLLMPVFAAALGTRPWAEHLERMIDFWSTTLLASGRYRGDPVAMHAALGELRPEHFDRWMEHFATTAEEVLAPELAAGLIDLAEKIRLSLEAAVAERA